MDEIRLALRLSTRVSFMPSKYSGLISSMPVVVRTNVVTCVRLENIPAERCDKLIIAILSEERGLFVMQENIIFGKAM